jgi:peroxiredoxin
LQELPHVQELWNTYQGRDDFELLVIGREETTETVTEFRKQHGYSFPIAADPDRAVYDLFATEFIPRTYLIGPDGIVCFAAIGFDEAEFATLRRELDKRLTSR